MTEKIDQTDLAILQELQTDASLSLETLADRVKVSVNTCWRRIQRLEQSAIIEKRVAILNADKLGKSMTVFVAIQTNDHSEEFSRKLTRVVESLPEIVEFYRLAGDIDYLLKIIVANVAEYDQTYKKLTAAIELSDVTARFSMEKIKNSTAIPL
ncbi:MAG: Lrp/AsnC family transcriptional regulator [Fimbriimonadaceae bacterium]|nr:Lrp/AsnC family transcriptional regulator [Alphaproteobacteria bacterium]